MTRSAMLGVVPIVVAMNTIYLTPHGLGLLGLPFTPTGPASRYIIEFRPVQMDDLLVFSFSTEILAPTYGTMFNLVPVASCAAAVASAWRRRIRINHLLLLAGAVVRLAKGARFRYEFVLLALPLIAANPPISARAMQTSRSRSVVGLVTVLSLAMSISAVGHFFDNRPKYPLSPVFLPVGVGDVPEPDRRRGLCRSCQVE